jgi:hypothetical protein
MTLQQTIESVETKNELRISSHGAFFAAQNAEYAVATQKKRPGIFFF